MEILGVIMIISGVLLLGFGVFIFKDKKSVGQ